jgi:signal transduction histidine kinase
VEEVELEPLVRDVVALFAADARKAGLDLRVDFAASVPRIVSADEVRLRQILANLIGNAVKFTLSGSVVVSVTAGAAVDDRAQVDFEITDTGVGISASMLDAIFDPFRQADMSKTRRFGGTGLGLSISRHLATMMGGSIAVRSTPGLGSVFTFSAPMHVSAVASRPVPATVTTAPSVQERRESVLLVEDNEINQRVATRLLRQMAAKHSGP